MDIVNPFWTELRGITWINKPRYGNKQLANVYMAYGNETTLSWQYSHAAIPMVVPGWRESSKKFTRKDPEEEESKPLLIPSPKRKRESEQVVVGYRQRCQDRP
jgi:hypothetical protein